MGEYIERKKAIDAIVKAVDTGFAVTAEDLAGILDDLPAADVAPVVHARWIPDGDLDYCSLCHFEKLSRDRYGYCPNCGKKMDGDRR